MLYQARRRFYRVLALWLVHAYHVGDHAGAAFFARQMANTLPEVAS